MCDLNCLSILMTFSNYSCRFFLFRIENNEYVNPYAAEDALLKGMFGEFFFKNISEEYIEILYCFFVVVAHD